MARRLTARRTLIVTMLAGVVLFGISFGYEDGNAAANRARIPRAGLEENIRFIT